MVSVAGGFVLECISRPLCLTSRGAGGSGTRWTPTTEAGLSHIVHMHFSVAGSTVPGAALRDPPGHLSMFLCLDSVFVRSSGTWISKFTTENMPSVSLCELNSRLALKNHFF